MYHGGAPAFRCPTCGMYFPMPKALCKHSQLKHPGKQVSKQIHQSKHLKTLDITSATNASYALESNMDGLNRTQELTAEHSEFSVEWSGQETNCDQSLLLIDTGKQGIRTEVGVDKQSDVISLGSPSSDNFVQCDKCSKMFYSQIYLEKHVRLKH